MSDIYVYEFGDSLYLNITNRCPNNCDFCIRRIKDGVNKHRLWLKNEPDFEQVKAALDEFDLKKYKETVFCGFGEPMCNLPVLLDVAKYLKDKGCRVRINTNGLASLINNVDTAKLIAPIVDSVSISLNASTAEKYQAICHSRFGLAAFDAMLSFAKDCQKQGIDTVLSVVDCVGAEEVEACRKVAESVGVRLRVRETINKDTDY